MEIRCQVVTKTHKYKRGIKLYISTYASWKFNYNITKEAPVRSREVEGVLLLTHTTACGACSIPIQGGIFGQSVGSVPTYQHEDFLALFPL